MGIYLNPDNEGFREAIHSKIYVDKTGLIARTSQCVNTERKFLCVSRPRRFGKSVVEAMNCRSFSMHVPVNTRSFQNDMYHLYIKDDALDLAHTQAASALSYNDENSLSCAIGLAYYSTRKDYKMIREFPTGHGFADIVFLPLPHTTKPALVVELKYNKTARAAIQQIKTKQYTQALLTYTGEILLVGINYDKKTKNHSCIIERAFQ